MKRTITTNNVNNRDNKMTNKSTKSITREDSVKVEIKDGKAICTITCLEKDLPSILKGLYEDITKTKMITYYQSPRYTNYPFSPVYGDPTWTTLSVNNGTVSVADVVTDHPNTYTISNANGTSTDNK